MEGRDTFTFRDAGWAIVRTPLASMQDFVSLPMGEAGWDQAFAALKRAFDDSPLVQEAIHVASAGFHRRLVEWRPEQGDEAATRKMAMSLWKYLNRMSFRPTPFGLFASVRGMEAGARTVIPAPDAALRTDKRVSLDSDACAQLLAQLAGPAPAGAYVANESAYDIGGEVRYFEARLESGEKSFHLVGVRASDAVRALLEHCAEPRTAAEAVAHLRALHPGADPAALAAFVRDAVESQLLLPVARVPVSGGDAIQVLQQVAGDGAHAGVPAALEAGLGAAAAAVGPQAVEAMERIGADLGVAGLQVQSRNLVQVDVNGWCRDGRVSAQALCEVAAKVARLFPYFAMGSTRSMDEFAARFERRYGERSVPLLEALDEEGGVGFLGARPVPSPLVQSIGVVPPGAQPRPPQERPIDGLLEARLGEAAAFGLDEIVLTDEDLAGVAVARTTTPPRTSCVFGSLLGPSGADGRHFFWLKALVGSTAASLLGRFAFENETLAARLRELARIDAEGTDAVHAEILHLSQDRVGNVVRRPVLRDHEIACLAATGVDHAHRIAVGDLYLSCVGSRLVLHSRRLGKRVVPHLSCMHNFGIPSSLPAYRFLCEYARSASDGVNFQAVRRPTGQRRIPRVRYGNIVLSPATWVLYKSDIDATDGREFHAAIRALAQRLGVPRHSTCGKGDNTIAIDLEDRASLQFLADELQAGGKASLHERLETVFGTPDPAAPRQYSNEVAIPVVARRGDGALVGNRLAGSGPATCPIVAGEGHRPGGKWCYVKVYGGKLTCERVAREVLLPVARGLAAEGGLECWFFIRYRDPDDHLRVRFRMREPGLAPYLALVDALRAHGLLAAGVEIALDEYKPETRRYGGPLLCALAESLFQHDSEMAAAALAHLPESNSDERWRFVLLAIDRCLSDFGLSAARKLEFARRMDAAYQSEFSVGRPQLNEFDRKYRAASAIVRATLAADGDEAFAWARALVERRSERWSAVVRGIRDACAAAERPLDDLLASYCHMTADRMFLSNLREHELVIYNFLHRHYRSAIAREARAA